MFPPTGALANRLTFEDVVRELATSGIEVFVASTENRPRGMTNAWFSANSAKTLINEDSRTLEIPAYTIFLAELVRRAGGGLYFLRESGTLSEVYRRIGATLRTQYILGFYPSAGADAHGWHNLNIAFSESGRTSKRAVGLPSQLLPRRAAIVSRWFVYFAAKLCSHTLPDLHLRGESPPTFQT